jgi:hypothetical protein
LPMQRDSVDGILYDFPLMVMVPTPEKVMPA